MASSVPVPSRDESSPLPDPPRADEAGSSPLALESSPAPLEAIDPARLFVNREGGSPPRPRLQEGQMGFTLMSLKCKRLVSGKQNNVSVAS